MGCHVWLDVCCILAAVSCSRTGSVSVCVSCCIQNIKQPRSVTSKECERSCHLRIFALLQILLRAESKKVETCIVCRHGQA